jgi:hypothetical protein
MKKICLLITGQMRTYYKCFDNIIKNLIEPNKDKYCFDIYILTEYFENHGGSAKNIFNNREKTYEEFKINIQDMYSPYLKKIFIETIYNKIHYPRYLNNYGPWMCLYRNDIALNIIDNIDNYDLFIRIRPDIVFSNSLLLDNVNLNNNITIICSIQKNDKRWLHNRDWDHMHISDKKGMELWRDYYKFIDNNEESFIQEIRFNNKGFWQFNKTNDKSIIATQLFMKFIKDNNYTLDFNESLNCYTNPIRL